MAKKNSVLPTLENSDIDSEDGVTKVGKLKRLDRYRPDMSNSFDGDVPMKVSISRTNALKNLVNKHNDELAGILLGSKESVERKKAIEASFRVCKEAFLEIASAHMQLLENRYNNISLDDIRSVVSEVICECGSSGVAPLLGAGGAQPEVGPAPVIPRSRALTYAAAVGGDGSKVHVSRGPVVEVPKTTSFLIKLKEDKEEFNSYQATKDAVKNAIEPSKISLKVVRMSAAGKNGVRIEAVQSNLDGVRDALRRSDSGLEVQCREKMNPRIIIYGVPSNLTGEEICNEIVALNLRESDIADMRMIYSFPSKADRQYTNCVIEVSPEIRKVLMKEPYIYVRYSACRFEDYVRILQCFKCLSFGHMAKDCKREAICGNCAQKHETRDCSRKDEKMCANCIRWHTREDIKHSALDGKRCPIRTQTR